jgi:CDP-glucose 4,6-dehydratase
MEGVEMSAFWRDRPVFVTGATGLLGGWLVRRLRELEADVVCLVRDWVPQCELAVSGELSRVKVVRGDVRDGALLERALGEYEIDTLFHLAAQTVVGVANRNPLSTFETNIQGTWALLEACRRAPTVRHIVLASSDKAYGASEILPYTEETPLQGRHPYDVSKSCADLIAQAYAATYGLPVAITRCGNLYGGGDLNWNRIVPGTIRAALRGERPVIRSDGRGVRDYLYVEDGVSAYLALAEALSGGRRQATGDRRQTTEGRRQTIDDRGGEDESPPSSNLSPVACRPPPDLSPVACRLSPGEAFNFGHNQPLTVLELVDQILKLCGRDDLEPDVRAEATGEISHQYLDCTRARRVLGWEPRFTLQEGLARTIEWYRTTEGVKA